MEPIDQYIEFCFKCPNCGAIHWINAETLNRKYKFRCWCKYRTVFPAHHIKVKLQPKDDNYTKLYKFLRSQKYSPDEINIMMNKIDNFNDDLESLLQKMYE